MMRCRPGTVAHDGPASSAHHQSASKTRVNALMVMHRMRDTTAYCATAVRSAGEISTLKRSHQMITLW
jgi:hypothetical protein